MQSNKGRGVQEIGKILLTPPAAGRGGVGARDSRANSRSSSRWRDDVQRAVHDLSRPEGGARQWKGAPAGHDDGAPLQGSPRCRGTATTSRKSASRPDGPIGDKTYTQVMVPMGQKDDWIAASSRKSATRSGTADVSPPVADVGACEPPPRPEDHVDGAGTEAALTALIAAQTGGRSRPAQPGSSQGALSLTDGIRRAAGGRACG